MTTLVGIIYIIIFPLLTFLYSVEILFLNTLFAVNHFNDKERYLFRFFKSFWQLQLFMNFIHFINTHYHN